MTTTAAQIRRVRREAGKIKRHVLRASVLLLVRVVRIFLKPKLNRAQRRALRHDA